jgi:hypothetical protein
VGCISFVTRLQEDEMTSPTPKDVEKEKEALASFAEREAALEVREAAVKAGEGKIAEERQALADAATASRKADALSFAEGLVAAHRIAPAMKDQVAFLTETLAANEALSFGEGDKAKSPAALFKALFEGARSGISFGEFAKPDGLSLVDEDPVSLGERALSFSEAQAFKGIKISAADAVRHVQKEKI